jgi:hypothetical protein
MHRGVVGGLFPPFDISVVREGVLNTLFRSLTQDGRGGTQAALADTRVPKVNVVDADGVDQPADFEVDEDPRAAQQLPLDGVPVVVTLRQVRSWCV